MHALASGFTSPSLACSEREEDLGGAPLVRSSARVRSKTLPGSILRSQMSWMRNRRTGADPPSVWISTKNSPMPGWTPRNGRPRSPWACRAGWHLSPASRADGLAPPSARRGRATLAGRSPTRCRHGCLTCVQPACGVRARPYSGAHTRRTCGSEARGTNMRPTAKANRGRPQRRKDVARQSRYHRRRCCRPPRGITPNVVPIPARREGSKQPFALWPVRRKQSAKRLFMRSRPSRPATPRWPLSRSACPLTRDPAGWLNRLFRSDREAP